MTVFTGYRMTESGLEVVVPLSEELIRDASDREAVARMAGELAAKTAREAVLRRGVELDEETEGDV